MKTILTTHGQHDFIISHHNHVMNDKGRTIFTDEPNKIAKHSGYVNDVVFYDHDFDECGIKLPTARRIELNVTAILALADKIREIFKTVTEEVYEPEY